VEMKRRLPSLPSKGRLINYSDRERAVFGLLPEGGVSMSTEELVAAYWRDPPFNANKIMIGTLRSIMRKVEYNGEDFRVTKSARRGPRSISFCIEAKG
jgi:hypothetical protein